MFNKTSGQDSCGQGTTLLRSVPCCSASTPQYRTFFPVTSLIRQPKVQSNTHFLWFSVDNKDIAPQYPMLTNTSTNTLLQTQHSSNQQDPAADTRFHNNSLSYTKRLFSSTSYPSNKLRKQTPAKQVYPSQCTHFGPAPTTLLVLH